MKSPRKSTRGIGILPMEGPMQHRQDADATFHFIGICGTAMEGVAVALRERGFVVTARTQSAVIAWLPARVNFAFRLSAE